MGVLAPTLCMCLLAATARLEGEQGRTGGDPCAEPLSHRGGAAFIDKGKTGREKCRARGNPTLPYVSGKKEFTVEIFISLGSKPDSGL